MAVVVLPDLSECLAMPPQASTTPGKTGFISITGVPSIASKGSTRKRLDSAIFNTWTRCRPIGFGRSGERVAKTPFNGFCGTSRGCTRSVSRSPWWSHVRYDFTSRSNSVERLDKRRIDLHPCLWCPLPALLGSVLSDFNLRANEANWTQRIGRYRSHDLLPGGV